MARCRAQRAARRPDVGFGPNGAKSGGSQGKRPPARGTCPRGTPGRERFFFFFPFRALCAANERNERRKTQNRDLESRSEVKLVRKTSIAELGCCSCMGIFGRVASHLVFSSSSGRLNWRPPGTLGVGSSFRSRASCQNVLRPVPDVHENLCSKFALTVLYHWYYDKGRASEATARADAQGFRSRLRLRERTPLANRNC